jgi:hypothetical protein
MYISCIELMGRLHSKSRKKCKYSIPYLHFIRGFESKRSIISSHWKGIQTLCKCIPNFAVILVPLKDNLSKHHHYYSPADLLKHQQLYGLVTTAKHVSIGNHSYYFGDC